jgi:hypothetical protein
MQTSSHQVDRAHHSKMPGKTKTLRTWARKVGIIPHHHLGRLSFGGRFFGNHTLATVETVRSHLVTAMSFTTGRIH